MFLISTVTNLNIVRYNVYVIAKEMLMFPYINKIIKNVDRCTK